LLPRAPNQASGQIDRAVKHLRQTSRMRLRAAAGPSQTQCYLLLVRSWFRALRNLWERAVNEHSSPSEIGWSVGIGALAACTPFIGLHMWIATGLATLCRKNRLWAFLGSRLSSSPTLAFIVFAEVELAHRLRTGLYAPLSLGSAVAHARELLGDWLLGTAIVAPIVGAVVGFIAWRLAVRWAKGAVMRAGRAEAHQRSLECPPSGPPTPIA
jgi:hypothetical protein